jgi:hypothetical protein
MSRYEYTPPRWPAHTSLAVGWDPPLATFFAQVMDDSISEDDDRVIVWVGGLPPYFKDIDQVMRIVNRRIRGRLPVLSLTKEMRDRLTRDKEREDEKHRILEERRKRPLCALDLVADLNRKSAE